MSSSGWMRARVNTENARRERERLAARALVAGEEERRSALAHRAKEESERWGSEVLEPRRVRGPGAGADTAALTAYAARLREASAELEGELDARRRVERARRAGERLEALRPADAPAAEVPSVSATNDDDIADTLAGAAAAGLDVDALAPLADAARSAQGEHRILAMTHLRSRVSGLRRERDLADRARDELDGQRDELAVQRGRLGAGVADPGALAAIQDAERIVRAGRRLDPDLLDGVRIRVQAALDRAAAVIDAQELEAELVAELERRGYIVDTEMESAGVVDGRIVTRPEWGGDHVIGLITVGGTGSASASLETLRIGSPTDEDSARRRDLEVEAQVCDDIAGAFEEIATQDVVAESTRLVPPGVMHMKVVDRARTSEPSATKRVRQKPATEKEAKR